MDEEFWEPHELGQLRSEYRTYEPMEEQGTNMAHAAMFMNLDE